MAVEFGAKVQLTAEAMAAYERGEDSSAPGGSLPVVDSEVFWRTYFAKVLKEAEEIPLPRGEHKYERIDWLRSSFFAVLPL